MSVSAQSNYRWFLLGVLTLIGSLVAAAPNSCMPALFKEISLDLNMDIVDIGLIWGIASLAGLFVSIPGGLLSDRLNARYFIGILCILAALTGAARGLANDFTTLALTTFINGIVRLILPVVVTKTIGIWFKGSNLGTAQGIGAMGVGFGLMLGPLISATYLSPWLGGWSNVLYFYGAIGVILGILWLLISREPPPAETQEPVKRVPVGQAISLIWRNKYIWLLGIMLFFRIASLMGVTGYVPTYLKDIGWSGAGADGVLAAFYAISTLMVVPASALSDKIGRRKPFFFVSLLVSSSAIAFIPFTNGAGVWVMMMLAGFLLDGFMALFTTTLLETEGVGSALSGTAIGVTFTIAQLGSVISPPIGNALDAFGAHWPFIFWALLGLLGFIPFLWIKETGRRLKRK